MNNHKEQEALHSALGIIWPEYFKNQFRLRDQPNIKLAHYTSADNAIKILESKRLWLRNVQGMNDYWEIEHGLDCINHCLSANGPLLERTKTAFDGLAENMFEELKHLSDSWLPHFRTETYISSFSEHHLEEDSRYGRLSMWRAYGQTAPVALVVKTEPFSVFTDVLGTYAYPVNYKDPENFQEEWENMIARLHDKKSQLIEFSPEEILGALFQFIKYSLISLKHPGFEEEREWRLFHNPLSDSSERMKPSIETISGIPQQVYPLRIDDIPEEGLIDLNWEHLLEKIIIGPCENQRLVAAALASVLEKCGVTDPAKRIHTSNIPYRNI